MTVRGAGELTAVEQRAVAVLSRGPTTCARLGDALWGRRGSGNCSCPWARPAGALLKRLVERGVVRRIPGEYATLYELARSPR